MDHLSQPSRNFTGSASSVLSGMLSRDEKYVFFFYRLSIVFAHVRWWIDFPMFDRILEINKKDAGAINHVMGFCGMEDELILLEEDLFLIKKFVQLFSR